MVIAGHTLSCFSGGLHEEQTADHDTHFITGDVAGPSWLRGYMEVKLEPVPSQEHPDDKTCYNDSEC